MSYKSIFLKARGGDGTFLIMNLTKLKIKLFERIVGACTQTKFLNTSPPYPPNLNFGKAYS